MPFARHSPPRAP
uniref:Uncharacterized protein n=1 Tax=Arundo donax TaxID=35708 RepID=A0A0A9A8P4_ARUDO